MLRCCLAFSVWLWVLLSAAPTSAHNSSALWVLSPSLSCIEYKSDFLAADEGDTYYFTPGSYDFSCFQGLLLDVPITLKGGGPSVLVDGGGNNGFLLADGLSNLTVQNIKFTNFRRVFAQQFLGDTYYRLVFDNISVSNSESAIHLPAHIDEGWVTNSSFSDLTSDGSDSAAAILLGYKVTPVPESAGRIHIIDNNFTDLARSGTGGSLEFHAILVRGHQTNVAGNVIRNFACGGDTTACEAIYTMADKSAVTGNSLFKVEGTGIILKGNSAGASGHQVRGNVISLPDAVDPGFVSNAAIEIQVDDAVVSENTIYNPRGYAILQNAGGTSIRDNVVIKPRTEAVMKVRGSNSVVRGNSIRRPIIDTDQAVIMVWVQGTGSDLENLLITNNEITLDSGLVTSGNLAAIFLWKYPDESMSELIIKDNTVNNLGASVTGNTWFLRDAGGATQCHLENNTYLGGLTVSAGSGDCS